MVRSHQDPLTAQTTSEKHVSSGVAGIHLLCSSRHSEDGLQCSIFTSLRLAHWPLLSLMRALASPLSAANSRNTSSTTSTGVPLPAPQRHQHEQEQQQPHQQQQQQKQQHSQKSNSKSDRRQQQQQGTAATEQQQQQQQ